MVRQKVELKGRGQNLEVFFKSFICFSVGFPVHWAIQMMEEDECAQLSDVWEEYLGNHTWKCSGTSPDSVLRGHFLPNV